MLESKGTINADSFVAEHIKPLREMSQQEMFQKGYLS